MAPYRNIDWIVHDPPKTLFSVHFLNQKTRITFSEKSVLCSDLLKADAALAFSTLFKLRWRHRVHLQRMQCAKS